MKHPIFLVSVCLILFVSGCCTMLLYKPTCNSAPIFTIKPPAEIRTLANYPRVETHVVGGINQHIGGPQPDLIKEMFLFRNDYAAYNFTLFYTEAAAKHDYAIYKKDSRVPVFSEVSENGISFLLFYDEQPRADPEGGCAPMGTYVSGATIRIRNLIVSIGAGYKTKPNDDLSKAVKYLADTLPQSWSESETCPNQRPERNAGAASSSTSESTPGVAHP